VEIITGQAEHIAACRKEFGFTTGILVALPRPNTLLGPGDPNEARKISFGKVPDALDTAAIPQPEREVPRRVWVFGCDRHLRQPESTLQLSRCR